MFPTLMVFNKIDRTHSRTVLLAFKNRYQGSVAVSAKSGEGIECLNEAILNSLKEAMHYLEVRFPIADGALASFLRSRAVIVSEDYSDTDTTMIVEADDRLQGELSTNEACTIREVIIDENGDIQAKQPRMSFSKRR